MMMRLATIYYRYTLRRHLHVILFIYPFFFSHIHRYLSYYTLLILSTSLQQISYYFGRSFFTIKNSRSIKTLKWMGGSFPPFLYFIHPMALDPSYSICASFLTSTGINGPVVKNIIIFWNLWLVCDWSWCRQRSFEKARREHDENSELNPLLRKWPQLDFFWLFHIYQERIIILLTKRLRLQSTLSLYQMPPC